nr:hypothetical protein [Sphingobium xenophagum]
MNAAAEIGARAEGAPRPTQQQRARAHCRNAVQRIHHLVEGLHGQRVQHFGTINRDRRHAFDAFQRDVFVTHVLLPWSDPWLIA